ncbi:MAG: STAS domain-containing protein [Gammaproteobacteria bacterium]|nr:STAS domain-containing protein [Gammaproteobacteria bacterium]
MSRATLSQAVFESLAQGRATVSGVLTVDSVGDILEAGSRAIVASEGLTIDFEGVTAGDSAGLALLIEWLSVARSAGRSLRYEHLPPALEQLARLSEVEDLLPTV